MFDPSRAARERQPEQKKWHAGGCERALVFGARGNRTAWQKGLRVRNSPTCTLSQNGYGTPYGGQKGPPNLLAEIGFGV